MTLDDFRREVTEGGRGDRLHGGRDTWFVAMCLAIVGEFILLPLVNLSRTADLICRGFLVLMGACLLVLLAYTLASGFYDWRSRRAGNE